MHQRNYTDCKRGTYLREEALVQASPNRAEEAPDASVIDFGNTEDDINGNECDYDSDNLGSDNSATKSDEGTTESSTEANILRVPDDVLQSCMNHVGLIQKNFDDYTSTLDTDAVDMESPKTDTSSVPLGDIHATFDMPEDYSRSG